ncbi:branched-chain amino acid ABC transporter permease [Bosea caraganae]|uniref:Branched-chain amino acid ABC transporter permease n=1 Tax=Bosea caraganae TaxID=2763117 RepID=A0A370L5J4_9HYPH|nr:branched-chain amino acid ABC transporter permease [Bosea caraganae]RDJ23338.1 branched-chain amino acid ABC transporter permease [Bosea caraganae]RDJ24550.1 branched-chain amino acid ABC transporter permease [Bosea caraganae]
MAEFLARRPIWSLIILVVAALVLWLVFSVWTPGMEEMFGRKRVFLSALFNGITLGALYFLVASGFTLIFGLMRNVNLAHGSLYLFGGYVGYSIGNLTGSWLIALIAAFLIVGLAGLLMQVLLFRWMEGQDLRQTLVTIGLSIIVADLLLWGYGGDTFQVTAPDWLAGPVQLPFVVALRSNGEAVMMTYPLVRIAILIGAIILGVLMWLALNRTRVGMLVRAGVDDRDMLSATGVRVQLVFMMVFAFGAGLAGLAGVVGGTFQSLQPGEDTKILLSSLVVVIVGGMGSIPGAAMGALIVGLAEQFGSVYMPTYAVMLTFVIMVVVLAIRPQGLAAVRR